MRVFKVLFVSLLISTIGVVELARINKAYFERQLLFLIMGVIIFFIVKRINLKKIIHHYGFFYIPGLILLLLPLFMSHGHVKRWINLGGFSFQPSEVAKIFFILFLAAFFDKKENRSTSGFLKGLFMSGLYFGLVFIEPDFATASTYIFIFAVVSYVVGIDFSVLLLFALAPLSAIFSFSWVLYLALIVLLTIYLFLMEKRRFFFAISMYTIVFSFGLFTPYLWNRVLKPYQRQRVISFLDPEKHRDTSGWQVYQGKIALGAAGFWGRFGESFNQKNLKFLPAPHTDFIFSSIGEDVGFLGLLILFTLYAFLFFYLYEIIKKSKKSYIKITAAGTLAFFVYHIVFNIASNLGLFPVAGIPLAFLSYGGTHIITEYMLLGIVGGMYERGE